MTHLTSSLHTHFGFDAFRAGQAEAIQSLLDKRHTLVVMPTGAGISASVQGTACEAARLDERESRERFVTTQPAEFVLDFP
jgi:hypothetical protein